jgi:hypothetical protein
VLARVSPSLLRIKRRPSKLRVNKRNRCAPFCDPDLTVWAKLCRAPTKESGCTHRTYGAGRADIELQIANLRLEFQIEKARQGPRERRRQDAGGTKFKDSHDGARLGETAVMKSLTSEEVSYIGFVCVVSTIDGLL